VDWEHLHVWGAGGVWTEMRESSVHHVSTDDIVHSVYVDRQSLRGVVMTVNTVATTGLLLVVGVASCARSGPQSVLGD
jgi:hypothetical protein